MDTPATSNTHLHCAQPHTTSTHNTLGMFDQVCVSSHIVSLLPPQAVMGGRHSLPLIPVEGCCRTSLGSYSSPSWLL